MIGLKICSRDDLVNNNIYRDIVGFLSLATSTYDVNVRLMNIRLLPSRQLHVQS